ncbi:MAG: MerR family transcriptional regulator [Noviherbaspirillum sp.]
MEKPRSNKGVAETNEQARIVYRSGAAARLAGLSAETLRVWERRYGLSDTERSERGQRLYSAGQVRRLGLLKQLVDQGHAIGVLAGLPLEDLETMTGTAALGAGAPAGIIRVALVGKALARRMAAGAGPDPGHTLEVRRSCARLDQAPSALRDAGAELLLLELSELDDAALPLISAARHAAGAAAVLVLYRFCASAVIRQLRAQDCMVARVPSDIGELALLCRAAMAGRNPVRRDVGMEMPRPRRFTDDALAAFSTAVTTVACECPRHLADILLMVSSFERYSARCASRDPADAELHKALQTSAGLALNILEDAMERLARAEGLLNA